MMTDDELIEKVFMPVYERVQRHAPALKAYQERCSNSGIEGWLKVEAVAELTETMEKVEVNNKGPDLKLNSGDQLIELKAETGFSRSSIRGGNKYGVPCLFLCDGSPRNREKIQKDATIRVVILEGFPKGTDDWLLGIAIPVSEPL
jgi:hypothetical protein